MKIASYIILVITMFFVACSDEKVSKTNENSKEEAVQIEKNDETTQLSDSNLPLPVDDEDKNEETNAK